MSDRKKVCQGVKPDGTSCQASVLPGSNFCFFHDPSKATERQNAQALGGRQIRIKTLDAAAPEVQVANSGDVIALLSETINQVRKGQLDPRIANSVGYLANLLLKAAEHNELETRIAQLEAMLKVQHPVVDLEITEDSQ